MDISEITNKILQLKNEKNVIILVHNYQLPEIQDIGDFIGDSFGLAQKAMETDASIIVFCGVDFMAESAKILNPNKIVIHPEPKSKCPMAAMVDTKSLRWMQEEHPEAAVVSYVNTTAEIKAMSDICCTSSNAVKIIKNLKEKNIIFLPDKNLGSYVKRFIKDKNIILWPGICPTHHKISKQHIMNLKAHFPEAEILVHPECIPDVIDLADYVYSTQGMVDHVKNSSSDEFIIGTEKELCYRLRKDNPGKIFHELEIAICPNMKRITLLKVLDSMKNVNPQVSLSKQIIRDAYKPLKRMVDIGREKLN
jgi:quinolinate synthase